MKNKGPQINHLCYVDDLLLFTSGDTLSIKMDMNELNNYKLVSGQLINRDKTKFYTYGCSDMRSKRRLRKWTGFKDVEFLFTYLGCLVYIGRKSVSFFADMTTKVLKNVGEWQGKMLSAGGRAIFINHILQSQTLYIMAALALPKTLMDQMEMYFLGYQRG